MGALLTAKFMRKSNKAQKRSMVDADDRPCLGIIINQWREKIGIQFGDPRTTPGGKAKNFSYFTRVEVARDEWIETGSGKDKVKVGLAIKARTIKNKTFPPHRTGVVDFYFDDVLPIHRGDYDATKEVFGLAVARDIIVQGGGGYYTYGSERWKGQEAVLASLREEVDLLREISAGVLSSGR
jgi:recombination protein RecA